jgi:excisionase family DNA binding protein
MLELLSDSARAEFIELIDRRVAEQLAQSPNGGVTSPWLTISEAADYLRTTPGAIRKRINRKHLEASRPEGSQYLLHRDDLDAFATGPQAIEVL